MEEILKRFLYAGVGFLSLTTSKVKETVDELINNRKLTEEEGKRIIEDFIQKTEHQQHDFEDQIRSVALKFGKDYNSSAESEIKRLKERIAILEDQLHSSGQEKKEHPCNERKVELFQKRQKRKLEELRASRNPVEKVRMNERVSLGGAVLTPEKKMEAERQRLQHPESRPAFPRQEQDSQKATLGGPILTPDKKVEKDSQEGR